MVLQNILLLVTLISCVRGYLCNYTNDRTSSLNDTMMDPCKQEVSTRHILLATFSILVFLTGIFGNVTSIIVIRMSRPLRSQVAYTFVTSLALADLGVSLFVTTVKIEMHWNNGSFCHGFGLCVFFHITDILFPVSSISHLAVIGIDRWHAIACPFTYVSNMTPSKAKYVVAALWFYSIFWTLLGLFIWDSPSSFAYGTIVVGRQRICYSINKYYHTTIVSVIYIIPMSATTCLYVVILNIALKQAATISKFKTEKRKLKLRRLRIETKATKTVASVFLAYAVCWLPHIAVVIIFYWNPNILINFHHQNSVAYDVTTTIISNVLPTISSCANPFIYFILSNQFRIAFKELNRKMLSKTHLQSGRSSSSRNNSVRTTDTRLNSLGDTNLVNGSIATSYNNNYGTNYDTSLLSPQITTSFLQGQ